MVSKDIDGAAVAADRVGRLDPDDPPARVQEVSESTAHGHVRLVEQAIELSASPTHVQLEFSLQRREDAFQRCD
jgi:hypothetical protein